jgi:hypothetical protein
MKESFMHAKQDESFIIKSVAYYEQITFISMVGEPSVIFEILCTFYVFCETACPR